MKTKPQQNYKAIILFILLLAFNNKGFSQESKEDSNLKKWEDVEVKPEFPGGIEEFHKFVAYNFRTSETEPSGEIIGKFIIETDGSLSNIEIIKNEVGPISGKELIHVLKLAPNWTPGSNHAKPVRVLFSSLPITIKAPQKG
jgi:protein TonB